MGDEMIYLEVSVDGVPIAQGSHRLGGSKARRRIIDDNPKVKEWRDTIADEVRRVMWESALIDGLHYVKQFAPMTGPVEVHMQFTVKQPKSAKRVLPHVRPDLDKYVRAVLDAITESGLWGDDGQVCKLSAGKAYGETPGVEITIIAL